MEVLPHMSTYKRCKETPNEHCWQWVWEVGEGAVPIRPSASSRQTRMWIESSGLDQQGVKGIWWNRLSILNKTQCKTRRKLKILSTKTPYHKKSIVTLTPKRSNRSNKMEIAAILTVRQWMRGCIAASSHSKPSPQENGDNAHRAQETPKVTISKLLPRFSRKLLLPGKLRLSSVAGCNVDRALQRSSPQEPSGRAGFSVMGRSACELPMPCEECQ